jgi:hypothetical protein
MAQMAAKFKESKLGPPAPARISSSSVGRELPKYTYRVVAKRDGRVKFIVRQDK